MLSSGSYQNNLLSHTYKAMLPSKALSESKCFLIRFCVEYLIVDSRLNPYFWKCLSNFRILCFILSSTSETPHVFVFHSLLKSLWCPIWRIFRIYLKERRKQKNTYNFFSTSCIWDFTYYLSNETKIIIFMFSCW